MISPVAVTNQCSQSSKLKRRWRNLEREQKEKVLELANGETCEKCLLKILKKIRRKSNGRK